MNGATSKDADELAEKVEALSRADFYGHAEGRIERIETHMSWVFLGRDHAYKLKKPVSWSDLDFSTLAAREYYCRRELSLNRRLAPAVYLDVVPLRCAEGRLRLGGNAGDIVDYLVKMQRLPADQMLDAMLLADNCSEDDMRALIVVLADFYRRAQRVEISSSEYLRGLAGAIESHCEQLGLVRYRLPQRRAASVERSLLNFIGSSEELALRAAHIVDGHGDLRPEHIYLGRPVQVIDCLEFDDRLRQLDPLDELSFLALECTRLQAPHIAAALLRTYRAVTGETASVRLVAFYQAHRALVRALLAIRHVDDASVPNPQHWRARALDYISLAENSIAKLTAVD